MVIRQDMFDEFFSRTLPDEGFTLSEVYNDYFGLLHQARETPAELHGHVVTMDGTVIVPELRPTIEPQSNH